MALTIAGEDIYLVKQPSVDCYVRINVLNDDGTVLDSLDGIIAGGSVNIDATSDIRRTASFTVIPTRNQDIKINEVSYIWLNRTIKIEVGLKNIRTQEIKWYSQGYYIYTDTSGNYDASTNTLQVNCADFMALLDGSRNGILGQIQTVIPAYEEDTDTGAVISYNYIRDAIIATLNQLGRITDIQIEDVGEYKGLESKNPTGYQEYRAANPTWNCIPYDLEFSCGDSVLTILTTLRDLYPNYEMFFDINNVFVCQMKPSGYDDDIVLTNDYVQQLLISENTESTSNDFTEVKNISEVWGEVIEADYYTENGVTYSGNVYIVPNTAYTSGSEARYYNGDKVAFKVPTTNLASPSVNIQSLGAIPIYDGENLNRLEAGILIAGRTYTFKIKRSYSNGSYDTRAIYMGQYQPHGMTVLLSSDSHTETYTTKGGTTVVQPVAEGGQSTFLLGL